MRRTLFCSGTLEGAFGEWPFDLHLSRDPDEATWELDVQFTGPGAMRCKAFSGEDGAGLLQFVEESRLLDGEALARALEQLDEPEAAELAREVRAVLSLPGRVPFAPEEDFWQSEVEWAEAEEDEEDEVGQDGEDDEELRDL